MKSKLFLALAALFLCSSFAVAGNDMDGLRKDFKTPPESVKTAVYWYWLNDNASCEGVVKDLQEMKKVGINRAFIGVHSTDNLPYGNVKILSDEWWEVLHTALKTATELGIEIGIFNCPGWSQSGGPWITPEQSMRYIALEPVGEDGTLPEMGQNQLVSVLAYPAVKGYSKEWTLDIEPGKGARQTLTLDKSAVIRTLKVQCYNKMSIPSIQLWCKGEKVADFEFIRNNFDLNVGFAQFPPHTVSIPDVESDEFEIVVCPPAKNRFGKLDVSLSEIPSVEAYEGKSLSKMFQEPLPMWDFYMWNTPAEPSDASGIVDPSKVMDLTSYVKDGKLQWNAPQGEWTVVCAYMKSTGVTNAPATPEGQGLEVDKMSREHIRSHFDSYMGEIIRRIPAEDRACWTLVVQDSYETGSTNWTDDMRPVFIKTYGYDPVPYLPALYGTVVGSVDRSDRFLWDLRRLVADRVAYDYVGGLAEVSHEHGMQTWLECYGHWGFPSEFLKYGGQSDQVSGEYWSEGTLGDIENKAASSCAHIYGKNQVWAESCTAGGPQYHRYPRMMKQRVDHFFCQGINASLLHLYIHQSDERVPGIDAWFGNEFNRKNAWWDCMDLFTAYLKRCNLMLQAGTYHADAAYFIGEDAPKMTGECTPALPAGYSYDYINAEILLEHARVRSGRLVLDSGMSYDVLVLPAQKTMRPEVLRKIARLARRGLTIVGPAPEKSPSMKDFGKADKRVKKLASRMWTASGKFGRGLVFPETASMEEVFSAIGIAPDVKCPESVEFIHRSLGKEGEIYFLSNQLDSSSAFTAGFKVPSGLCAELFHPTDGSCEAVKTSADGDYLDVEFSLDALESVFVVFSPEAAADEYKALDNESAIEGPWTVAFAESCGNPAFERTFPTLQDWAESTDSDVRYYSGHASYSCEFEMPSVAGRTVLDLGNVMVMAKVKVNGNYVGGVWTDPYTVDITGFVREGKNELEVEVYNNWRNRLAGDDLLPEAQRKTWTNISQWNKSSELQSSGLLGPVKVLF